MASWLDVLAQNHTDPRGRFNPFSFARGFTKQGRHEIDQQQQLTEGLTQEQIDQIQRNRGAREFMSTRPDPQTAQGSTMEEQQVINQLLSTLGMRGNLRTQDVNVRSAEQNLQQSRELHPGNLTAQATGNRRQATAARVEESIAPFQVGSANVGLRQQEQALGETQATAPARTRMVNTGADQADFNLQRSREMLPRELTAADTANRSSVENLVEQIAGQDFRIMDLKARAEGAARGEQEAVDTAQLRRRVLERNAAVDPRVMEYLRMAPLISPPEAYQSGTLDREARSMLGLPYSTAPSQGADDRKALLDAVQAVAGKDRYQSGGDIPPVPETPQEPVTTTPKKGKFKMPTGFDGLKLGVQGFANRFGNPPLSEGQSNQLVQLLHTPEGQAKIRELYPQLDPTAKQQLLRVIEAQLKGQ